MKKRLPNIILFLSDDLGYNDLSCYVPDRHHTPHIDRLAGEGVRFTDFHSNGAVCSPTRAALLTGRYPQRCGVERVLPGIKPGGGKARAGERATLSPSDFNLGRAFAQAGYATAFFGKYHTGYLPDQSPLKMGFGEFRGICGGMDHHSRYNRWGALNWWVGETPQQQDGYATDLITDHGLRFITEHRDEPFLLYLPDWCVHFPWQGPHDPADFRDAVDNDRTPDKWGSQYPRRHRQAYREMVEAQDRNLGRIADTLEALGLREDTLLIFCSDNGGHHEVTDNAPLRGHKGDMFEGGHRVPAFCRWPGRIPAGRVSQDAAMTMDLLPTLLSIAGIAPPQGRDFDGIDLSAHLFRGTPLPERPLFWRVGSEKAAARQGRWKYVRQGGREWLFDLADDLGESTDLLVGYPDRAARLRQALAHWEQDVDTSYQLSRSRA
ncbi:MAG: sulfatase-like hydrolase/transferase [Candidatus Brocadiia bacterium]